MRYISARILAEFFPFVTPKPGWDTRECAECCPIGLDAALFPATIPLPLPMKPIDEKKLRLRRQRRAADRRTAEEAAEIVDAPKTARPPQKQGPQPQTESAFSSLAEAFALAEAPAEPAAALKKEKPLSARQIRTLKRNAAREGLECCRAMELRELEQAASAGDAAAQFVTAERYEANGYEEESLLPLLRAAAEQAFPPAMGLYGFRLAREGDTKRGEEMMQQAAEIGYGEGACRYGLLLLERQQSKEVISRWLELAGKSGYIPAYKTLADVYHAWSWRYHEADWLKKAADAGDAESAYRYASLLTDYRPLKGSDATRMHYYMLALQNGCPRAVFPLTRFHRRYEERLVCISEYIEKGYIRVKYPIYKTIIGDCERAVEVYLEAAARAPELRDEILEDIMAERGDAWKTEHRLKALQGLADMGHAPAVAKLRYLRQEND